MCYLSLSCTGFFNSFFFFFLSFLSSSSSSSSSVSEPSSLSSLSDPDPLSSLPLRLSEPLTESDSEQEKGQGQRVSRSVHLHRKQGRESLPGKYTPYPATSDKMHRQTWIFYMNHETSKH